MSKELSASMEEIGNAVVASKANHKYIQPCYPLGDNIVSHRITKTQFGALYRHYNELQPLKSKLLTQYHSNDIVLEIDTNASTSHHCYISYRVDSYAGNGSHLEFVGEDHHDLPVTRFPLTTKFHHERQTLVFFNDYIQLEISLTGIYRQRDHKKILEVVLATDQEATDEESPVISLSLKIPASTPDLNAQIQNVAGFLEAGP